jgi:TonB-linked SusC/RagA family outer membrane protein
MILTAGCQNKDGSISLLAKTWMIMKLTIAFLLFFNFRVSANGDAQKITIVKKNASLTEIFKAIERQTGFLFFYDKAVIQKAGSVDIAIKDATLDQALSACLKGQKLTYSIVKNTVVIRPEKKITYFQNQTILTPMEALEPPPVVIRGRVVNKEGSPLQNVSIVIAGTQIGTTTNADGRFTLTAPDGRNLALEISSVGYQSKRVNVGKQTDVNVVLELAATGMDEVVVTALGIKRQTKSLTYSVQTVGSDDIDEAKTTNIATALQGKVAGLRITMSPNGPGSSASILLRGLRSLSGNNQPLIIIDGVPLDNSSRPLETGGSTGFYGGRNGGDGIGMINSDNVASMTVLKGASAAALYGSQGQNGAIIITTKSGKVGKIIVNYTGNVSVDKPNRLPKLQSEYGQGTGGVYDPHGEGSWGPKATGQLVTLWNGDEVPLVGQSDHLKNFLRNGLTINNTVSLMGGDSLMQTYFSYGNTNAKGIIPNQTYNRNNFDLKIDNKVTSKLSFSAKLTYIIENNNNKATTDSHVDVYTRILKAPVSIPLSEMRKYEYYDPLGERKQSFWKPGSVFNSNPYWALNRHLFYEQKDRVLGLLSAKYSFTDWLNLQIRASMDKLIQKTDDRMYEDSYFWAGYGNVYSLRKLRSTAINVDALLSFNRKLTNKIGLNGNVGASIQESKYESLELNALGLIKPDFFFMQNAKNLISNNLFGRSPQIQSLYGVATLSYMDVLYLSTTMRNDWSSALTPGHQSYFYPTVGLSALISEMIKLPSWISYGKARITYAKSGYGGNQYLDRNYFSVLPGGIIRPSLLRATADYKPELTSTYEVGLDSRFFSGRLGLSLTYYQSHTINQLIQLPTSSVASLFSSEYVNAGLIQNRGLEFVLDGRPLDTRNFSWDATLNFSSNKNKIVRLDSGSTSRLIGGSIGDVYAQDWRRDTQGRRLVDDNGRPIFGVGTVYFGKSQPDYMLGFMNEFSYKKFSLSFLIDYSHGGVVNQGYQSIIDIQGTSQASLQGREGGLIIDGYTSDGKKNTKSISAESYWTNVNGVGYIYSATNMRLREAELSFRLSNRLLDKTHIITSAKLSLVGRNLFWFKIHSPFDPEQSTGQVTTRNIGVNLKLTF